MSIFFPDKALEKLAQEGWSLNNIHIPLSDYFMDVQYIFMKDPYIGILGYQQNRFGSHEIETMMGKKSLTQPNEELTNYDQIYKHERMMTPRYTELEVSREIFLQSRAMLSLMLREMEKEREEST